MTPDQARAVLSEEEKMKLRRRAEAISNPQWLLEQDNAVGVAIVSGPHHVIHQEDWAGIPDEVGAHIREEIISEGRAIAHFIARANPTAVLSLLNELEDWKELSRAALEASNIRAVKAEAERDQLRGQLAVLTAQRDHPMVSDPGPLAENEIPNNDPVVLAELSALSVDNLCERLRGVYALYPGVAARRFYTGAISHEAARRIIALSIPIPAATPETDKIIAARERLEDDGFNIARAIRNAATGEVGTPEKSFHQMMSEPVADVGRSVEESNREAKLKAMFRTPGTVEYCASCGGGPLPMKHCAAPYADQAPNCPIISLRPKQVSP